MAAESSRSPLLSPPRGVRIDPAVYRDKVLGCWHGKNIGGTLGGPLEEKFGRDELFDVDWYPDLPPGGIPNDDLELQLIWLQALEERGPGLRARDLAEYWLDCVRYNFDEYGLSKANLVRGLVPPVSGWHNNWFRDCMGSPIRSELWACIAPGAPEIAAHYAFEDAICDHGGGESVFGEVFNAVVESCAFVESDKLRLVEAGLSAIPPASLTAGAIRRAVELHADGCDWREARQAIKREFHLPLAQYSPINLGFQTIGFLYGTDFADAICKAVNCGWDTDCTGATVGAMLGIILGAKKLPARWVAPLKDEISTNLPNGGIRHLRAPTDVNVLTDRVASLAPGVLRYWNSDTAIAEGPASAPPRFVLQPAGLATYDPGAVSWDLETLVCTLRLEEHAAIFGDQPRPVTLILRSERAEPLEGEFRLRLPPGWAAEPAGGVPFRVGPGATSSHPLRVKAPASAIAEANRGTVEITVRGRPALPDVPLVLLGGFRWLISPVFPGSIDSQPAFGEESILSEAPAGWTEAWRPGNDLAPESVFRGVSGVAYFLHYVHCPAAQVIIVGVSNTRRMKLWVNGVLRHQTGTVVPGLRPNQGNGGGDGSNYRECEFSAGWNQVLIKLERGPDPLQAHFTLGLPDRKYFKCLGHAVTGLRRAQFPWEAA
jgi:ADP-ribosylglycohydrolase